jgi:hypothetical protein
MESDDRGREERKEGRKEGRNKQTNKQIKMYYSELLTQMCLEKYCSQNFLT